MPEQPKCCGTCAWFEPIWGTNVGDCNCPIPDWAFYENNYVCPGDGEDCPCHKPKEPERVR